MKRSEILETAAQYTTSDRNSQYGEPEQSFGRIAEYWSVYLNRDLNPVDVSVMMALFKVARIEANPGKPDSWIDLAGYAACGGEIATADTEPTNNGWLIPEGEFLDLQAGEHVEFAYYDGSYQIYSEPGHYLFNGGVKRYRYVGGPNLVVDPEFEGWIKATGESLWIDSGVKVELEFTGALANETRHGPLRVSLDGVTRYRKVI